MRIWPSAWSLTTTIALVMVHTVQVHTKQAQTKGEMISASLQRTHGNGCIAAWLNRPALALPIPNHTDTTHPSTSRACFASLSLVGLAYTTYVLRTRGTDIGLAFPAARRWPPMALPFVSGVGIPKPFKAASDTTKHRRTLPSAPAGLTMLPRYCRVPNLSRIVRVKGLAAPVGKLFFFFQAHSNRPLFLAEAGTSAVLWRTWRWDLWSFLLRWAKTGSEAIIKSLSTVLVRGSQHPLRAIRRFRSAHVTSLVKLRSWESTKSTLVPAFSDCSLVLWEAYFDRRDQICRASDLALVTCIKTSKAYILASADQTRWLLDAAGRTRVLWTNPSMVTAQ